MQFELDDKNKAKTYIQLEVVADAYKQNMMFK